MPKPDDVKLRLVFKSVPSMTIVYAKVSYKKTTLWHDAVFLAEEGADAVRQFWRYVSEVFGSKTPDAVKAQMVRDLACREEISP